VTYCTHSVYMGCVNGMDTASSRGSCVASMWYLCMKMSWRCVGRSLQIGNVVGMCGDNVADVKFWVTVACMEGNSVRDWVSRYSLLIWVAKRHLGGTGWLQTCKQLGRSLSRDLDFWYAKRVTVRQWKSENFNGYWMRYMIKKLENVRKVVYDEWMLLSC